MQSCKDYSLYQYAKSSDLACSSNMIDLILSLSVFDGCIYLGSADIRLTNETPMQTMRTLDKFLQEVMMMVKWVCSRSILYGAWMLWTATHSSFACLRRDFLLSTNIDILRSRDYSGQ